MTADPRLMNALAAQHLLCGMSDDPDQMRDPLAPMRALFQAQRDALAGDDDGDGVLSEKSCPF